MRRQSCRGTACRAPTVQRCIIQGQDRAQCWLGCDDFVYLPDEVLPRGTLTYPVQIVLPARLPWYDGAR